VDDSALAPSVESAASVPDSPTPESAPAPAAASGEAVAQPTAEVSLDQRADSTPDAEKPRVSLDDLEIDPEELLSHPKFRPKFQSWKDREIERVAREREAAAKAAVEAEFRQREQESLARQMAEAERQRLESLSDEELGRELREKDRAAQIQTQLREQVKTEFYQEAYPEVFQRVGSDVWDAIQSKARDGELSSYGDVVATAIDLKAQAVAREQIAALEKDIEKRAKALAETLYQQKLAELHLSEEAPLVSPPASVPDAPTYRRSQIKQMDPDDLVAELPHIREAFLAGRVIND